MRQEKEGGWGEERRRKSNGERVLGHVTHGGNGHQEREMKTRRVTNEEAAVRHQVTGMGAKDGQVSGRKEIMDNDDEERERGRGINHRDGSQT